MKKQYSLFGLLSGILFCFLLFVSYGEQATESTEVSATENLPQVIHSVDLNRRFSFAGEMMPRTFDARERLDREMLVNSYWHSNTVMNIKLANRYFPTIERILIEEGVPTDFKYLAVAESGLRPVVSPAKAVGFWQFRKTAGQEFGLEMNKEVDERYHVEKSTVAACKYIKQLHRRFGSWTNAAAAYNMGPTRFAEVLKEQGETDYYNLNVNQESGRYVFRLMAIKEILSDPAKFGFYINAEDMYQPLDNYYEVKIDQSVKSWGDFSSEHGITYRDLKIYNPWLRTNKLTVLKNTYRVRIPR